MTNSRIRELDGFRAIAIFWVFVMHIFYASGLPPAALSWMPRIPREIIAHGWLGVDLFFVLSGLLITGILLDSRGSPNYFRSFYVRRVLRILPLYLACILVMWFAYQGASAYFGLSLLFMANFAHLFQVAVPKGAAVFWSLAIEEHFYLLWPLLVYCLSRKLLLSLCILIIVASPLLRGLCAHWGMDPEAEIYTYSYFRFDGLAFGATLAIWIRSRFYTRAFAVRLAVLFMGGCLLLTAIGWPLGIMATKSVASTALRYTQAELVFAAAFAMALAYQNTVLTGCLRSRAGRFAASLSYCVYLIHVGMIDLYLHGLKYFRFDDTVALGYEGSVLVRFIVIGAATIAVAMVSRKYLEGPFLSLKRYY